MRAYDPEGLLAALGALRAATRAASDAHDFTERTGRGERVVMRRLRHFLLPAGGADAELAARLYSGDSALLPAMWRFLGAPPASRGSLQAARDGAIRAMPRPHADFLASLSSATGVRAYVEAADLTIHALASLESEFNACLDELTRFCSRRSQLVCRYLPTYAAEFRKHEFEHDRRALLLGRLGLVQGRRARPRARPPP
jgi:hypothetical protein